MGFFVLVAGGWWVYLEVIACEDTICPEPEPYQRGLL